MNASENKVNDYSRAQFSKNLKLLLACISILFKHSAQVYIVYRDVSTGSTGATRVAPKFSDTLTLFQPGGGADSTHHWHGRTKIFLEVSSLPNNGDSYGNFLVRIL